MALAKVNRPIDWNSVSIIQKKHSVIMDTRQKLTGCQEGFTVVKEIDQDSELHEDYAKIQTTNPFNGMIRVTLICNCSTLKILS